MKVVKARHAGACYGVQRALDMAYAAICDGSRAYTLGPLIHNPQVVTRLEERGVAVASTLDDIDEGIVIIRSHGVVPQVKHDAEAKGLPIIDATCPHVARAQKAASGLADEGYHVIAVGEAGHPEVEGMKAHALRSFPSASKSPWASSCRPPNRKKRSTRWSKRCGIGASNPR